MGKWVRGEQDQRRRDRGVKERCEMEEKTRCTEVLTPFTLYPLTPFTGLFGSNRNREGHAVNGSAIDFNVLANWLGIRRFNSDSILCRFGCQSEYK